MNSRSPIQNGGFHRGPVVYHPNAEACAHLGIEFKSKVDLAVEHVRNFEADDGQLVYVLFDSGYVSKKLIDVCNAKGFHVIAAFKTKRMIYPAEIGIQVADFAKTYIRRSDLCSVTAEDREYKIYEYEGQLSDIENVKALLCWEDGFSPGKLCLALLGALCRI